MLLMGIAIAISTSKRSERDVRPISTSMLVADTAVECN